MNKQFISFLLILALLMQQLPFVQVSSTVPVEQLAEELPDGETNVPENTATEEAQKHFVTSTYDHLIQCSELSIAKRLHIAENLVSRFSDDVETRPPDC